MSFGQPIKDAGTPWALYVVMAVLAVVILFGIMNGRSESVKSLSFQGLATATDDAMKAITPDLPR